MPSLEVIPAPTGGEPPAPAAAPKKFAGKYDTPEDLEKGYKELEAKLGAPKPAAAPPSGEAPAPSGDAPKAPSLELQKPPAAPTPPKGFDLAAAEKEFIEKGKLSDATYKSFAGAGFSKDQVDQYIEGQRALSQQRVSTVLQTVGGEEAFKQLQSWAIENYSEEELASFNELASSKSLNTVLLAYEGLKARFLAANGSDPKLLGGEGAPTGPEGDVFQSMTEMTTAMGDPRYRTDAAFRKRVDDKVLRTDFAKLAR